MTVACGGKYLMAASGNEVYFLQNWNSVTLAHSGKMRELAL